MNVLDLFSGIGGFSLGLERAGFKTVAFCEIEPYPRAVLRKHWPDVPCYDDVRTLTAERLAADGITVDVICGGFPCQDISNAGKRAGIEGERSGLWREYARLIGELRPKYVIVENVAALLGRGMGRVLGDLAEIGYDAEWQVISAADVGAPHLRERVWIVAYGDENSKSVSPVNAKTVCEPNKICYPEHPGLNAAEIGKGVDKRIYGYKAGSKQAVKFARSDKQYAYMENPHSIGFRKPEIFVQQQGRAESFSASKNLADSSFTRLQRNEREGRANAEGKPSRHIAKCDWWRTEPDVGRVANGVSSRVDKLKGLGNAVVPQIPEIIGRAIMRTEGLTA
jgi:DNA (cytosine-5)-methyltransferase 1